MSRPAPPIFAPVSSTVSSPCVGICEIEDGLCQGCARTLEEIAAWSGLDEATRQDIMRRLPERQA